jgi:nitroreductase
LLDAASNGNPQNPLLPENFRHYRSELGHQLFGEEMGIPRDDLVARKAAVLRNYDFFGAPLVAIIYMDKMFSHVDSLSVGMWLQTFILELTAHGLDTCVEGSIAGFPHVIAKQVGIESNMEILCGLAVGYGNPDFRANHMVSGRDSWKEWIQIRT